MSMLKSRSAVGAVLSAEEGRALPAFDLLGRSRRAAQMAKTLNQARAALAQSISHAFTSLFNGNSCRLEFDEFTQDGPPRDHARADGEVLPCWIVAHALGRDWSPALLWFDSAAAYRLAVLFFGGSLLASDLKHPCRPLTDAEQRLMQRLFRQQLDIFSRQLGLADQDWELQLLQGEALPKQGEWFSAQVNVALGDQTAVWQLWWPFWQREIEPQAVIDAGLAPALNAVLPKVPLQLRLVLAQTRMKLEQLTGLKAGDIIAVDWPETALALLGPQPFLRGRVAEQNKGLVFQVTEVIAE